MSRRPGSQTPLAPLRESQILSAPPGNRDPILSEVCGGKDSWRYGGFPYVCSLCLCNRHIGALQKTVLSRTAGGFKMWNSE